MAALIYANKPRLPSSYRLMVVDTVKECSNMLESSDELKKGLSTASPLFIKGNPSSPYKISSLILFSADSAAYLVNTTKLQDKAFDTPSPIGTTLRSILESDKIPEVFYDVRITAIFLSDHYHVNLAGVRDLQVTELAMRGRLVDKTIVSNLNSTLVEYKIGIPFIESFRGELGSIYFDERALALPGLYHLFARKLECVNGGAFWNMLTRAETERRLEVATGQSCKSEEFTYFDAKFIEFKIDQWNADIMEGVEPGEEVCFPIEQY